jgi:hypothetical protein
MQMLRAVRVLTRNSMVLNCNSVIAKLASIMRPYRWTAIRAAWLTQLLCAGSRRR